MCCGGRERESRFAEEDVTVTNLIPLSTAKTGPKRYLMSGHEDGSVKLWDLTTLKCCNAVKRRGPIVSMSVRNVRIPSSDQTHEDLVQAQMMAGALDCVSLNVQTLNIIVQTPGELSLFDFVTFLDSPQKNPLVMRCSTFYEGPCKFLHCDNYHFLPRS